MRRDIKNMVKDLPELLNNFSLSDSEKTAIANEWYSSGFNSIEIWDWMVNGYKSPDSVIAFKLYNIPADKAINLSTEILQKKYGEFIQFSIVEDVEAIALDFIKVNASAQNQGIGSKFMTDLIEYADVFSKVIRLTPSSEYGSDYERLLDFYLRFGFVFLDDFLMERVPLKSNQSRLKYLSIQNCF